ncbi:MAG: 2-phospho-L-lactate guanylyltransferase [Methanosaeta sp. PtaU1.Bin112]|nr:MAG: 2-phospho-L-lactate guanylyltransferase [Methanosaeta sp. PtaU1.Bin112]
MQRPIRIVVPFKLNNAKSRLAPALTPEGRRLLAFAMLRDVLDAVSGFGRLTVLSRPGLDAAKVGCDVEILESELDLNDALNSFIAGEASLGWPSDILIVMSDLALLTQSDVAGILSCPGDVVLCPGRGGGTNMILIRNPRFRTCYRGLSFPRHQEYARQSGLAASVFESFRAGSDIDRPEDMAEVLLHGRGRAKKTLESLGFILPQSGQAGCVRT